MKCVQCGKDAYCRDGREYRLCVGCAWSALGLLGLSSDRKSAEELGKVLEYVPYKEWRSEMSATTDI